VKEFLVLLNKEADRTVPHSSFEVYTCRELVNTLLFAWVRNTMGGNEQEQVYLINEAVSNLDAHW